jgi:hypothetical protein
MAARWKIKLGLAAMSFSASPGVERSPTKVSIGKVEDGGAGGTTASYRVICDIDSSPKKG